MNYKEECLKLYRHEKIDFIPDMGAHMNFLPLDQLEHGCGFFDKPGEYVDIFGATWLREPSGAIPKPGVHRLSDITAFREEGVIPTDEQVDAYPWDALIGGLTHSPRWDEENKFTRVLLPAGFFERLHHLMGMEEAMIALIEEPEAVLDFNWELLRYKKRVIENVCSRVKVDVLDFMDDYGSGQSMFMSRDMWLELYYEPLKELIRFCNEKGIIYEQHSDGYITPIIGDLVAAGAAAINPLEGINDIDMVAREYSDKLLVVGGDTGTLIPHASDEQVIQIVKKICSQMAHTGSWVPNLHVPGVTPERDAWIRQLYVDELTSMGYTLQ